LFVPQTYLADVPQTLPLIAQLQAQEEATFLQPPVGGVTCFHETFRRNRTTAKEEMDSLGSSRTRAFMRTLLWEFVEQQ
jgi:hypothetical protein